MKKLILFIFPLLLSCSKEAVIPCTTPGCNDSIKYNIGKLEIAWSTPLHENLKYDFSQTPVIHNNYVVYSKDFSTREKLIFYDRFSGEQLGVWDGQKRNTNLLTLLTHPEYGIITTNSPEMFSGTSYQTMKTLYEEDTNVEYVRGQPSIIGNYYYFNTKEAVTSQWNALYRINLSTGTKELIKKINKDEDYKTSNWVDYNKPVLYDKSGPRLLIYPFFNYEGTNGSFCELKALDEETAEWRWQTKFTFDRGGFPLQYLPKIHKDMIIAMSQDSIFCVSAETGEKRWAIAGIPNQYGVKQWGPSNSDPYILGDKLYCIHKGVLYCFSADTGEPVFSKSVDEKDGIQASPLSYFEGVFYFTSLQHVFAVRASDGTLLLKERSHNYGKPLYYSDPQFTDIGVTIDAENRLMYTSDNFEAICYKIPDFE